MLTDYYQKTYILKMLKNINMQRGLLKTLICFQCGAFSGSLFIYFKHMLHLKAERLNKLFDRKHKKRAD